MKTTKALLSIALIALTTTLFGRIGEPEADCNCCPTELIMDQDIAIENWMIEPFESNIESELALESWMSEPFKDYFESEPSMEAWMVIPFESTENVVVEQWMAAAWF